MMQLILMLLGLVFSNGNGNGNTTNNNNNSPHITVENARDISLNPGTGLEEDGNGGPVTGNTGQTPPPFTNP